MVMGFRSDIRSGKRDPAALGGYAVMFWICAGFCAGGGLGFYLAGPSEKTVLAFVLTGATIGACIGFYAAFGRTRLARVLALPGLALQVLGMLVGL